MLTARDRELLELITSSPGRLNHLKAARELSHVLDPVRRALMERQAAYNIETTHALHAIMRGTLHLGTYPQSWDAGQWRRIVSEFGQQCPFLLVVVAFRGYGLPAAGAQELTATAGRYPELAAAVFGREVLDGQVERVCGALAGTGFQLNTRVPLFRQCVAALLLHHASPTLDAVTDASLEAFALASPARSILRVIATVSTALVTLGIVRQRVTRWREPTRLTRADRLGVEEEWLGWCKRWHAASPVSERTRRGGFGDLMTAGRWLKRDHPEVTSPAQWTLDLAFAFVRFVNGMRVGELLEGPRPNLPMGQPLTPNAKAGILSSLRCFFRDLHQWEWIEGRFSADRGFALPRQIQRSRKHNPRPIDEGFWLKLRTASLSLRHEDLPRVGGRARWRYPYPLELIQALAVAWTFSGCRSDEIERLEVGCAYVEHVPEQTDLATGAATPAFDQPMLRVPVNKTRGEFVKPIEAPLLEAILAWERVRPPQPALPDATTGRLVHHLFCFRGRRVGHGILNYVIIPILLRKAGLPEADSRGAITSHRARATMATKLYNGASGLGPLEVMSWLGHTHFSSTQHYLALTPVRLMTAFHKGAKLTENLRMVSVLVDSRPEPGQPVFRYDLGHGWCTNPAYAMCAHRMACARCSFYEPAETFADALMRQSDRYVRMLQELNLLDDERAATTGDLTAINQLLARLADEPTPRSSAAPAPLIASVPASDGPSPRPPSS